MLFDFWRIGHVMLFVNLMLNIALWLMASLDVVAFVNSKKVYVVLLLNFLNVSCPTEVWEHDYYYYSLSYCITRLFHNEYLIMQCYLVLLLTPHIETLLSSLRIHKTK